jgi:hypothetical protein
MCGPISCRHLSADVGPDLAWTYEQPLLEATHLAGLVAFHDEIVDITVDGQGRDRPGGAIVAALLDEAGV